MVRLLVTICAIVLLLAETPAYGADWPMAYCDAQNSGCNAAETALKLPLQSSWVKGPQASMSESRTRPVIAGGLIYVGQSWAVYEWGNYKGTESQLQAISLADGKPVWTVKGITVSSAPALSNGRIYFGTQDGSFCARSSLDGGSIWQISVDGAPTSPVIFGHIAYFGTSTGKVYAVSSDTGSVLWVVDRHESVSMPAVTNNAVFVGGSRLVALDPANGEVKWWFACTYGSSSPAVSGSNVYISCGLALYCLDVQSGRTVWSHATGDYSGAMTPPTVSGNTLYWGAVTAFDASTGAVKWAFDAHNMYSKASVAVADGYVFVGSTRKDPQTVFDTSDGRLYVLRADSGESVWQYEAGVRLNDWYFIDPSPAVSDRCVVLNLSTWQLSCFTSPRLPASLPVSVSKSQLNPYDLQDGFVDVQFTLESSATVSTTIADHSGTCARTLVDKKPFPAGQHSIPWFGLIDFPEMADPTLRDQFGDKCIMVAPDGTYSAIVTAEYPDGSASSGSTGIEVKADV